MPRRPGVLRISPSVSPRLSTMGFSYLDSQIPALVIASTLWGMNLVLLYLSLRRLFGERDEWKRSRDINFPMATIVILLFLAATISLAFQLTLVMRGHKHLMQSRPEDYW